VRERLSLLWRRLRQHPFTAFTFILGALWKGVDAWSNVEFLLEKLMRPGVLSWAVPLLTSDWIPAALMAGSVAWLTATLARDPVFQRARVVAPKLREYLSLSRTIQREVIHEPDKSNVHPYAHRIEHEWRAGIGKYLADELPAASEYVLEKLAPAGLDPFRWEFVRLQRCTQKLEAVLANLDHWVKLSGPRNPRGA
jgi:hypothetical protein